MPATGFRPPPSDAGSPTLPALYQHTRQISSAVRMVMQGKVNATGAVTLTASATTTTITDNRLAATSAILFDPVTANAAAELAAGTMYVLTANRNDGAFVVTHANAGSTDRTFRYVILG